MTVHSNREQDEMDEMSTFSAEIFMVDFHSTIDGLGASEMMKIVEEKIVDFWKQTGRFGGSHFEKVERPLMAILIDIMRRYHIYPSFGFRDSLILNFVDRLESYDEKLNYLAQVSSAQDSSGYGGSFAGIRRKQQALRFEREFITKSLEKSIPSPELADQVQQKVSSSSTRRAPRNTRSSAVQSVPKARKIHWTGPTAMLPFLFKLLHLFRLISDADWSNRHALISAHFLDKAGLDIPSKNLMESERNYNANKLDPRPRLAKTFEPAFEKLVQEFQ